MHTYSFIILTAIGMWRPLSWNTKWSILFYRVFTTIQLIVYYTFMLSEILDIVLVANNIQQVTENMIQLINIFNVSQKNLSYLFKRNKIIKFMDLFFDDLTLPQTPTEEVIQRKYDEKSKGNSIKLFILYTISVSIYVYVPFFMSNVEDRFLPYRGWRPFSLENLNYYYLTYLHECWAVMIAATGNAATETLVSGFMMQICAQFEILQERFLQMPKILNEMQINSKAKSTLLKEEKSMIIRLVKHHLRIFEMIELLNDIFVFVILTQFIASISVLCVTTYNLAFCSSINEFCAILLYIYCMMLQIFLYTWYGNEITLKSVELGNQIFLSDWRLLSAKGIQDLMIIFQRTTKPIILSSGYIITLSNAAFTSIIKTSYSVYNLLAVQ